MLSFSFRNRIAFHYIVTTALLVFVVFLALYSIVKFSVYEHINKGINIEVERHLSEVKAINGKIILVDEEEWTKREHNSLDVNPVFIQFVNLQKKVIEKSPNLKKNKLSFVENIADNKLFDTQLKENVVRQIQVPIFQNTKKIGYLLIAMSLEDSIMVLNNLQKIMVISYPLILLILFLIARVIAGKSIKPINTIIETSNKINKDNLSDRIVLPQNKDELYVVSQTINNLLNRLENTIEREKQFTSDASHELRTPLAVIKGTLEVLIRKPRETQEYQEKIIFCIAEVDRINDLVDQLLILTRFENQKKSLNIEKFNLNKLIDEIILRYESKAQTENITILKNYQNIFYINSDIHLFTIVLNNIISNAIKYSLKDKKIIITLTNENNKVVLEIKDNGIGIKDEEISKVFNSFYRTTNSLDYPDIKGIGLGLSIVKRLSEILSIEIEIKSLLNQGTAIKFKIQN